MGLRALASTCLLLAGCSFDASLPPGAMPRCQSDRDCPPPLVCTPLDEAERFCLPPGEEFPDVVASSVEAAIVPGPGSLLERPSVLGPRSDLALRFGTTEPLAEAPEVSAPLLGCAAITAESTSFEVRCVVRADVVEPARR